MPSIMTLRTWPMVAPMSAMRWARRSARPAMASAWARTHSAPVRVLPEPRPPRISQVCQERPLRATSGGSWSSRATTSQSHWMRCNSSRVRMPSGASSGWRDKLCNPLRNLSAEDVRLGCEGLGGCGSMCCSPGGWLGVRGVLRVVLDGLLEGGEALDLVLAHACWVRVLVRGVQSLLHASLHDLEVEVEDPEDAAAESASRLQDVVGQRGGVARSGASREARGRCGHVPAVAFGAFGDGVAGDVEGLADGREGGTFDTQTARLRPLLSTELGDEAQDSGGFRR